MTDAEQLVDGHHDSETENHDQVANQSPGEHLD